MYSSRDFINQNSNEFEMPFSQFLVSGTQLSPNSAKEFQRLIISSDYSFSFSSLIQNLSNNIYNYCLKVFGEAKRFEIDNVKLLLEDVDTRIREFTDWQRLLNPSADFEKFPDEIPEEMIKLGYYLWKQASESCDILFERLSSLLEQADFRLKSLFNLTDQDLSLNDNEEEDYEYGNEFDLNLSLNDSYDEDTDDSTRDEIALYLIQREHTYNCTIDAKNKFNILFGNITYPSSNSGYLGKQSLESINGIEPYTIPAPLRYAAQLQVRKHLYSVLSGVIGKTLINYSLKDFSQELKISRPSNSLPGKIFFSPYGINSSPTFKASYKNAEAKITWQTPLCLRDIWLKTGLSVLENHLHPITKIFQELGCDISIDYRKNNEYDVIEVFLNYRSEKNTTQKSPYESLEEENSDNVLTTPYETKPFFSFFLGISPDKKDTSDGFMPSLTENSEFFSEVSSDNMKLSQDTIQDTERDSDTCVTVELKYLKNKRLLPLVTNAIDQIVLLSDDTPPTDLTITDGEVFAVFDNPLGQNKKDYSIQSRLSIPLASLSSEDFLHKLHLIFKKMTITDLQFCWISDDAVTEVSKQLDALLGIIMDCGFNSSDQITRFLSLKPRKDSPNAVFCELGYVKGIPLVCTQYDFEHSRFLGKVVNSELFKNFTTGFYKALGLQPSKQNLEPLDFSDPCFSEKFFSNLRKEKIIIDDTLKQLFFMVRNNLKKESAALQSRSLIRLSNDLYLHHPSIGLEIQEDGSLFLTPIKSHQIFSTFSQKN